MSISSNHLSFSFKKNVIFTVIQCIYEAFWMTLLCWFQECFCFVLTNSHSPLECVCFLFLLLWTHFCCTLVAFFYKHDLEFVLHTTHVPGTNQRGLKLILAQALSHPVSTPPLGQEGAGVITQCLRHHKNLWMASHIKSQPCVTFCNDMGTWINTHTA